METVIDPNHMPLTQKEMNLFNEKRNSFILFSTTSQTDRGKKCVREHEDDFDAQIVYKKLCGFCTTFSGALFSASDMLSYITSTKFESWKGTTKFFILK